MNHAVNCKDDLSTNRLKIRKKIIRAFMKKAVKTDVVWCSKYFVMEYADTVYLEGEAVELVDYLFWENEYLDVVRKDKDHRE